jgi:PAS domain S-box-containing protein
MFGYTAEEWRDTPDLWARLIHPDDRERVLDAQRRYMEEGSVFDQEYRTVARDGSVLWVHDVAFVVNDDDGTPLYSQGFLLDITAQKEAELRLREDDAQGS